MYGPVPPRAAERKSRFTFLFFAPARAPLTRCRTLARTPGRPRPHPHSPPLPALILLARRRAPSFFKKSHTLASAGSLASGRRSPSFSVNTHTPPLRCPPPRWRWTPPPMRSTLCGWCVGAEGGSGVGAHAAPPLSTKPSRSHPAPTSLLSPSTPPNPHSLFSRPPTACAPTGGAPRTCGTSALRCAAWSGVWRASPGGGGGGGVHARTLPPSPRPFLTAHRPFFSPVLARRRDRDRLPGRRDPGHGDRDRQPGGALPGPVSLL